jgi:hypothetical protein
MTNEEIYIRDRQKERAHVPKDGSLRDQFAMAALTGILAYGKGSLFRDDGTDADVANFAYACADAMLERRREYNAT